MLSGNKHSEGPRPGRLPLSASLGVAFLTVYLSSIILVAADLEGQISRELEGLSNDELIEIIRNRTNSEPTIEGLDGRNPLQLWLGGLAGKAREAIHAKLNPTRDGFMLIKRYYDWFNKYRALFDERQRAPAGRKKLLTPVDLLATEYARTDRELFQERVERLKMTNGPMNSSQAINSKPIETTDYLYDVLDKLMRRLEEIDLTDAQTVDENLANESERTSEELRTTPQVREALERLKRIGLNTAQGVVRNELMTLVRMVLANVLAANIGQLAGAAGASQIGDLASLLLGATGNTMAIQYLADVNRRTLLGLLGVLNPVQRFKDNFGV